MALRSLFIDGFGHFHHHALGPFAPGLVVLHGPNEAGKTTLSAFLLFVLFGPRRGDPAAPLDGGRLGGRLTFDVGDGLVEVERLDKGSPVVRASAGVPAATVEDVLGGVDRALFRAIYAFSLDDLRSFEHLGAEELRDRLFTGSLAGAGRSVSVAVTDLERRAAKLWMPRGACALRALKEQRVRVDQDLAAARRQVDDLGRKLREIEDAEREHRDQTKRVVDASREASRWRALIAALPHEDARRRAEAEAEGLPRGREIPAPELFQADQLASELADARVRLELAEQDAQRRSDELDRLPPPPRLVAHALDLESLGQRAGSATPQTLADRAAAVQEAEVRLNKALREVGLADVGALDRLDLSAPAQERLRALASAAVRQRQRHEQAREQAQRREGLVATRDRLAAVVRDLPRDPVALAAVRAVEALGRDQPAVLAAKVDAGALARRHADTVAEAAALEATLGPQARSASTDLTARGHLAAETRALQAEVANSDAGLGLAAAQVELCAKALTEARRLLAGLPKAPEASAPGLDVVEGLDRALSALQQAQDAAARATETRRDLERILASLGKSWTEGALAGVRVDPGTLEDLRGAAAAHAGAVAAATAKATEVAALEEEAGQVVVDPRVPGRSVQELQQRLDDIEDAEIALRERFEQAAQGTPTPAYFPWWLFAVAVLLGVVLLGVGVGGVATGATALGAVVGALGLLVLLVALLAMILRVARPAPAEALVPPTSSRDGVGALAKVGLPASASAADLQRRRRDTQRAVPVAARREQLARVESQRADLQRAAEEALRRWNERLQAAGWPAAVSPEAFERTLSHVLRARDRLAEGQSEAARAKAAQIVWTTWLQGATPAAQGLGQAPPDDARTARALIDALRVSQLAAEDRRRQRRDAAQREADAAKALAEAEERERAAKRGVAGLSARRAALRDQATNLGVPAEVDLEVATAWLGEAAQLRERLAAAAAMQAEITRLEGVVASWHERFEAGVRLGLGLDGADALDRATRRCQQAEAWQQKALEAEVRATNAEEALQAHDADQASREAALVAHADDEDAWARAVQDAYLPSTVSAAALEGFLDAARRACEAALDWSGAQKAHHRAQAETTAFVADVAALAEAVGEVTLRDLGAARTWLQGTAGRVAAAQEADAQAARLRAALRSAQGSVSEQRSVVAGLQARLDALLGRFAVADLASLKRSAHDARVYAEVAARAEAAGAARDAALGRDAVDPAVLSDLAAPDEARWRADAERADVVAGAAREAADQALTRRTTVDNEVQALRGSKVIADLDVERAAIDTQFATARAELGRLLLAKALLERTLKRFREAHQPQILRTASGYLTTVTEGAYVGVESDDDGQDLILIDLAGGRRSSGELSRGTAEALYLVLRLSLARETTGRDHALPLLLDDVLVNLDPQRAAAVADLLGEVAQDRQVVLLTCRPETRDLLVARVPETQIVELPRFAGRGGPVAGTSTKRSAAPEVRERAEPRDGRPATDAVLAVLAEAAEPLGKEEILRRTGISDAEWSVTIGALRTSGRVVQTGKNRGAKYQVADG